MKIQVLTYGQVVVSAANTANQRDGERNLARARAGRAAKNSQPAGGAAIHMFAHTTHPRTRTYAIQPWGGRVFCSLRTWIVLSSKSRVVCVDVITLFELLPKGDFQKSWFLFFDGLGPGSCEYHRFVVRCREPGTARVNLFPCHAMQSFPAYDALEDKKAVFCVTDWSPAGANTKDLL